MSDDRSHLVHVGKTYRVVGPLYPARPHAMLECRQLRC